MSYEEYVSGEALELTEEISAEETVAEEAVEAEAIELVDAEPVAEEEVLTVAEAVEAAEDDDLVIEYSVEEPASEPVVDETLFDAVAEEDFDFDVEAEDATPSDPILSKCEELRSACKDMVQRISKDLEATNYNPYIRSTTTYKYEILKKSTDTEPVDVFEFQKTSGYSLRAMAITTALVAAADVAVGRFLKKKLKK